MQNNIISLEYMTILKTRDWGDETPFLNLSTTSATISSLYPLILFKNQDTR